MPWWVCDADAKCWCTKLNETPTVFAPEPTFNAETGWLTWQQRLQTLRDAYQYNNKAMVVMRRAHVCDIVGINVMKQKGSGILAILVDHQGTKTEQFVIMDLQNALATAVKLNRAIQKYASRTHGHGAQAPPAAAAAAAAPAPAQPAGGAAAPAAPPAVNELLVLATPPDENGAEDEEEGERRPLRGQSAVMDRA